MNIDIAAIPEADFGTVTAPGAVRIQRLLPGPIERVWEYLADGGLRRQWLAAGDMAPQARAPSANLPRHSTFRWPARPSTSRCWSVPA